MNKKVPLMSSKDCALKRCPFHVSGNGNMVHCNQSCQAWTVVTEGERREDHSGGAEMIRKLAIKYGVEAKRYGAGGSSGYWEIPPLGYCKRLWPTLDVVSPSDYNERL